MAGCPRRSPRLEPSGGDGGVPLDKLVIMPPAVSPPWAKESRLLAASPALVKILHLWLAPCITALYSTVSSGLMDVFGSSSLKNSVPWIVWDSSRASHTCDDCALHCSTISTASSRLMDLFGSLLLENSPRGPWIHRSSPCEVPLTRARSNEHEYDAFDRRVNLSGNLCIQATCSCSCCEVVNDNHHVEPCNSSCFLGGLTLGTTGLGRHRHHRVIHLFAQMRLSRSFNFTRTVAESPG